MPSGRVDAADFAGRVLLLAPVEGDADALCHVLGGAGFDSRACADMADLTAEISAGAGAVILTQEAFPAGNYEASEHLAEALSAQPDWSDLPLILLAAAGAGEDLAWTTARRLAPVGNISILERPLRRTTLLSAVAVALRARVRQYKLHALLDELAQHRGRLAEQVERRTAELAASMASLHAAERLAALGTLAAGLGHDIANLTLPIRARLEGLACSTADRQAQEDIAAISDAVDHLTGLSAGMRLMALDPQRVDASTPTTDLARWGAETQAVLRASLPRHVRLECVLPPGLGVPISRHRLAQAVFNLVQNAGEAMATQKSGTVRITAGAGVGEGSDRVVSLRISDDGPGMSPDVLNRCFEPYFSTKGRAIATGMGLSMVRGIVESVGGTVAVESRPGQGTAFTLTIPGAAAASANTGADVPAAAVSAKRERTAVRGATFRERP